MNKTVWLPAMLLWATVQIGCAAAVEYRIQPATPAGVRTQLLDLAESYYRADSPAAMEDALSRAQKLAPSSAIYHELAADLAYLKADRAGRFDSLARALLCPDNDLADLHLHELNQIDWTLEETRRAETLFESLALAHPSPRIRAIASQYLGLQLHRRGETEAALKWLAQNGWKVPFSIVGTWDNQQGKGIDLPYPPESEIDMDAEYRTQNLPSGWRINPVTGEHGELDLFQLMYPNTQSVAYALAAVEAREVGSWELHLTTTDPVKIWVNGQLVYVDGSEGAWTWDLLTIPIVLRRGANRILVKTAQNDAGWDLMARITRLDGAAPEAGTLSALPPGTRPVAVLRDDEGPWQGGDVVESRLNAVDGMKARRLFTAIAVSTRLGLQVAGSEYAEQYIAAFPSSLRGKVELALSLWDNQERGRASDLLQWLVDTAGDRYLQLQLHQIHFWQQNDLTRKAFDGVVGLHAAHPDNAEIAMALVDAFDGEGWTEDKCALIEDMSAKWPRWPSVEHMRAECYDQFGFGSRHREIIDVLYDEFPGEYGLMQAMYDRALNAEDFDAAEEMLRRMIRRWPERGALLYELGELKRRTGDTDEAERVWLQMRDLSPAAPSPWYNLASMSWYNRNKEKAVEYWRGGLVRDPANGGLAERLAYLAPQALEPWESDIPSEEALVAAVARRDAVSFDPSADFAYLLDHGVTQLRSDGSTISVTTSVMHALNMDGRDALTEYQIPCYGYSRILHAYAVDAAGTTQEAASIRDNTIRFRGVEVGSSVVVQSRCETGPDTLIGDYFSTSWSFQGFGQQFEESAYVLWAPSAVHINEFTRGKIARVEKQQRDQRRIEWSARRVPILRSEQSMPFAGDLVWRLELSTVPDWEMFLKWEDALLKDAFRKSPEVVALADTIFKGAVDNNDRLNRIQAWVTTNIRYQQDYENHIAGVKPHTAQQVIARRYGDCKDKSVLFITLAELAGIDARFALIRTRDMGEVVREVPSQQFNHAIVYVPPQAGIAAGRFIDPTVDALDVDALRTDNSGTQSLVFDQQNMTMEWVAVAFQDPAMNLARESLTLNLEGNGSASGTLALTFKGQLGAILRQSARNPEQFRKVVQVVSDGLMKGSVAGSTTVTQMTAIDQPVDFSVDLSSAAFARVSEDTLFFRVPFDAKPEELFTLEKRDHDLLIGAPNQNEWTFDIRLPLGAKVDRVPLPLEIDTPCMRFSRIFKSKDGGVEVAQTLTWLCERIPAAEYPMYREQVNRLTQATAEEVIVKLKQKKVRP